MPSRYKNGEVVPALATKAPPILKLVQWQLYLFCDTKHIQISSPVAARSAAARLLGLRVWSPPGAWMFVCCECCVLWGRGLCDELITLPEESYRLWCVTVCDLETLLMGRPLPTGGCRVLILRPFLSSCFGSLCQFTPHNAHIEHVPSVTSDCKVFIIPLKFTQAKF